MGLPKPTAFTENRYDSEWLSRDYFYSVDGVQEYPKHPCKKTFRASLPFVRAWRNAVDVGCRDGEFSRYLTSRFQHVYCFDYRIRKYFSYNVDVGVVTHFACALGDVSGEILVYKGAHVRRRGAEEPSVVPCCRLDDFCFSDVDYLKIDTDGYELRVLRGAEGLIERCRPLVIIEDADSIPMLPGEERHAARYWLEARGYSMKARSKYDYVMAPDRGA